VKIGPIESPNLEGEGKKTDKKTWSRSKESREKGKKLSYWDKKKDQTGAKEHQDEKSNSFYTNNGKGGVQKNGRSLSVSSKKEKNPERCRTQGVLKAAEKRPS